MSNLKQCGTCKRLFAECPHYSSESENICEHYEAPIDNSKMFSHWYTWKGRIGRLEYILSVLLVWVVFSGISFFLLRFTDNNDTGLIPLIIIFILVIFGRYLIIVAGIKRCHDSRSSIIYAYLISSLSFSPWGIVGAVAAFYLLFQRGEDEINEHGTVPQQPYQNQESIFNS